MKKQEHRSNEEGKLQDKKEKKKEGYLAVVRIVQESSTDLKKKVIMLSALSNTDLHILTVLIRLEFRVSYVTKFGAVAP